MNAKPSRGPIKFDPPKMMLFAKIVCPDCGWNGHVPFSPLTLEGDFYCVNIDCRMHYRLKLLPPDTARTEMEEMLKLAVQSIQKSRDIDWSTTEIATSAGKSASWSRTSRGCTASIMLRC